MTVTRQDDAKPPWLLLVFSLARKGASLRVTVWRKLQRYGALPLGNSGYFLPNTAENRERFEWLATAVRTEGGDASVLEVQSVDNCSFPQMKQRFSDARAGDYRELLKDLRKPPTSSNLSSRITRLRQRFQDVVSIDFFGNPLREQVEHALNAMQTSKTKALAPEIGSITPAEYRNRVWVTRPRPGVDRVTSAWLIRKFIDPKAKFTFAPACAASCRACFSDAGERSRPVIRAPSRARRSSSIAYAAPQWGHSKSPYSTSVIGASTRPRRRILHPKDR